MKSYILMLLLASQLGCTSTKEANNSTDPVMISKEVSWDDKVQVLLHDGTTYTQLEQKYTRYGLTMLYPVSKSQEKYMFQFDPGSISKKELLRILNRQIYVESARDSKPIFSKNKQVRTSSETRSTNAAKISIK